MTRTGIEQGGGAMRRKQSPSGALFSPRGNRPGMSTGDTASRMCELFYFVTRTGIEQGGGAMRRKQSPSGALFSPRGNRPGMSTGDAASRSVSFFIL